jgi:hypothetical protein
MGVGNRQRSLKNKEDKKNLSSLSLAGAWLGSGKPHMEEADTNSVGGDSEGGTCLSSPKPASCPSCTVNILRK